MNLATPASLGTAVALGLAINEVCQRVQYPMPLGVDSPFAPWWLPRPVQEILTVCSYIKNSHRNLEYFEEIFDRLSCDNFCFKIPFVHWTTVTRDPAVLG
jgi:hypothetical protein